MKMENGSESDDWNVKESLFRSILSLISLRGWMG